MNSPFLKGETQDLKWTVSCICQPILCGTPWRCYTTSHSSGGLSTLVLMEEEYLALFSVLKAFMSNFVS